MSAREHISSTSRHVDSRDRVAGRHRPSSRSRSRSPDRTRDRDRRRTPSPGGGDKRRRRRSYSRSPSPSQSRRKVRSRSRSRDRDRDRNERKRQARSASSSSDSDDSRARRRKDKKKEKRRDSSKERRREKKKEKKDKKKKGANSSHWGKYGIISDMEIYSKVAEFQAWLIEERKVNPERITKDQEKKEFSRFVEDFNTATLPHEKYYNIDAYEKRMNALRQGEYLPPPEDSYDFEADMKAVKSSHKKKPVEQDTYLSREELMELRKVQQERTEIGKMKLLGMDIKSTYGVRMDSSNLDD